MPSSLPPTATHMNTLTTWLDMTSSSSVIFSQSKVLPLMSVSFKHPLPFPVSLQLDSFFHYFLCLSPHHLLPLIPPHTSTTSTSSSSSSSSSSLLSRSLLVNARANTSLLLAAKIKNKHVGCKLAWWLLVGRKAGRQPRLYRILHNSYLKFIHVSVPFESSIIM